MQREPDMDEIEDLPIVREDPPAPIEVTEQRVQPVLTEAQYNKVKFCYATPDMATKEIEPNTVYWDWVEYEHVYQDGDEIQREKRKRKQIKFLLLPNVISNPTWLKAHLAAEDSY